MKFLIMTADKFPPNRVDVRVLFGEEMAARGHEIDWILQSDSPLGHSDVRKFGNGKAWVGAAFSGSSRFAKSIRKVQAFFHDLRVFSLARRNDYDFIQVKDKFVGALFALSAARLSGTKFVYWLAYPFPEAWLHDAKMGNTHHPIVDRLRGWISTVLLYRVILPRTDLTFVQSEQMKRDIASNGIAAEKMFAVPMGVSLDLLSNGSQIGTEVVKSPSVAYLGTMLPIRRIDFVIHAFSLVLQAVPDATLYMIGGERVEDIEALRQEAQRLGIGDRVVFTGSLPRHEALRLVAAADVCLSPLYPTPILNSVSSTKLVEYMALGKPVVGNQQPEQSRVLEESGGGLCVPYDVSVFADAVVTLLKDPRLAGEMGQRGRAYVSEFRSYPRIASIVENVIETVIGSTSCVDGA